MLDHLYKTLQLFNYINIILFFFFFYLLYIFIVRLWKGNILLTLKALQYKGKQRVHQGEIPRLGGVLIYSSLLIYFLLLNDYSEFTYKQIKILLICTLPMIIVIAIEDLFHNIDFRLRLLVLFISCSGVVLYALDGLPLINNIIIISDLVQYPYFNKIFFILCLIALSNGCNFIDGMNGLYGFYIIGVLMSCLQLSFIVNDIYIAKILIIYFLLTSFFLIVNYPWGKIFMGDSGAYLMAILLGVWVINFFYINESISSWNAVLIFFYPVAEVMYSFIRKLYQKKSPFKPDREHLHLKVYDIVHTSTKNPFLSNNLTTVFLAVFWLFPPLILPWVFDNQYLIFLIILMLALTYIIINIVVPSREKYKI